MTKQEIIQKYEKEISDYNKVNAFTKANENNEKYSKTKEIIQEISCFVEDIKNLDEGNVKRSELIDFLRYANSKKMSKVFDYEKIVNSYLKSINSSEA